VWLGIALSVILLLLLGGTLVFHFVEKQSYADSLWMALITISTVGYSEPWELSLAGRATAAIILVLGVGAAAVMIAALFEVLMHRQIRDLLGRRNMDKQIAALKGHVIVCGFGRMGRVIAEQLDASRKGLVVVERSPEVIDEMEETQLLVPGDAREESVLERANVHHASALVAALGGDADNVFLTLTARQMCPQLPIIVRAEDDASIPKFRQAGASRVVCPYQIGANHVVRLLTRPHIVDFIELADRPGAPGFEVQELPISEEHPFAGKTLAEGRVHQEAKLIVLAIRRANGSTEFDPDSNTRIQAGDTLIGVSRAGNNDS
jgi:voltage-gated potassium channel